jgi:small subunit ribosomal protein S2
MALPEFTMRQLLEAGVHFGHQTHRWNPKMAPYIYGARGGVHIIDLSQTMPALHRALAQVREVVASGGRVLFVGTKRQAAKPLAEAAKRCGQHYVDRRWLGGMLTNWQTISKSIKMLKQLDEKLAAEDSGLTKKELLGMTRERDKLERSLGGIRDMGGIPDIVFIIDTNREDIAINEARRLGIPVVAILDTNCDPGGIAFPIPGNDDALRAIQLYCDLVSATVLDGIKEEMKGRAPDIGAAEEPAPEPVLEAIEAATATKAAVPSEIEAVKDAAPEADVMAAKSEKTPDAATETAKAAEESKEEGALLKVIKKAKKVLKTSKSTKAAPPESDTVPTPQPKEPKKTETEPESATEEKAAEAKDEEEKPETAARSAAEAPATKKPAGAKKAAKGAAGTKKEKPATKGDPTAAMKTSAKEAKPAAQPATAKKAAPKTTETTENMEESKTKTS